MPIAAQLGTAGSRVDALFGAFASWANEGGTATPLPSRSGGHPPSRAHVLTSDAVAQALVLCEPFRAAAYNLLQVAGISVHLKPEAGALRLRDIVVDASLVFGNSGRGARAAAGGKPPPPPAVLRSFVAQWGTSHPPAADTAAATEAPKLGMAVGDSPVRMTVSAVLACVSREHDRAKQYRIELQVAAGTEADAEVERFCSETLLLEVTDAIDVEDYQMRRAVAQVAAWEAALEERRARLAQLLPSSDPLTETARVIIAFQVGALEVCRRGG